MTYRYIPDDRPPARVSETETVKELLTRFSRGENIPHEAIIRAQAREALEGAEPGTVANGIGWTATKRGAPPPAPSTPTYTRFDQMPADWK